MIRHVCAVCGSKKVSMKTWLDWSETKQQWVPDGGGFDSTFCKDCDEPDGKGGDLGIKTIKLRLTVAS